MKLRMLVLSIGAALMMGWTAFANAATLTFLPDPLVGFPGNSVPTSVVFAAEGALVSALQFDVLYDPNPLSLTSQTPGGAAITADKGLALNTPSPGDTRIILFGLNQNAIGTGSVTDLRFQVSLNAPPGPYSLSLSEIVGADPNANSVTITNLNPPTAIPEPAALWLLGIGLGALALWRQRKSERTDPIC